MVVIPSYQMAPLNPGNFRGLSKDNFYKWIRTFEKQSGSTAKVTPVNFLEIEASPADRKDPLHMRCLRIITSYGTILEIPL